MIIVSINAQMCCAWDLVSILYSCDCSDPANLCKHIHKVLNALHHQMTLKKQKTKKKNEENISELVTLMQNLTVKSL